MRFEFATATRILFGAGSSGKIAGEVKTFGRCALLITGGNVRRVEKILTELSAAGIAVKIFQAGGEPEIATVEDGVAMAKNKKCDFVISLGGGSVIDAGKAIAAMLTNDGESWPGSDKAKRTVHRHSHHRRHRRGSHAQRRARLAGAQSQSAKSIHAAERGRD